MKCPPDFLQWRCARHSRPFQESSTTLATDAFISDLAATGTNIATRVLRPGVDRACHPLLLGGIDHRPPSVPGAHRSCDHSGGESDSAASQAFASRGRACALPGMTNSARSAAAPSRRRSPRRRDRMRTRVVRGIPLPTARTRRRELRQATPATLSHRHTPRRRTELAGYAGSGLTCIFRFLGPLQFSVPVDTSWLPYGHRSHDAGVERELWILGHQIAQRFGADAMRATAPRDPAEQDRARDGAASTGRGDDC